MTSPKATGRERAARTRRPRRAGPALSGEQLTTVLALLPKADRVELKASVPDTDRRSVVAAFGMDPLEAQIRQVAFYDTPDLALDARGLVVRLRRVQGRPGDAVVKLRPVVPEEVPAKLRSSPAFSIEVDAMPGGFVCSGTMKAPADSELAKATMAGARPLRKLLTKAQRAFYAEHAPAGVDLDGLTMLGPINVFKLKFRPPRFDRRLVAELWLYPDGSRILELSAKATPAEAFDVAAATKALLARNGVDLSAAQQTKTKTALRYFVRELTPSAGAP